MTTSAVCANETHFSRSRSTGKERDTESGNDYFGARYYASTMGRWLSPDWSAQVAPVPYARMDNPQTLNLYAYLRNNPLAGVDADGHCTGNDCDQVTVTATTSGEALLSSSNGGRTATAQGTVDYAFTYKGKTLDNTAIHEEVSNVSTRDGVVVKVTPTTSDSFTGPANDFPAGTVTDMTEIRITFPFGGAQNIMETSVFSNNTTQILSFKTPTGSSCSVTETRTLTNADSKGQPTDEYKVNLTSPATQKASPVRPPPPPPPPQSPRLRSN